MLLTDANGYSGLVLLSLCLNAHLTYDDLYSRCCMFYLVYLVDIMKLAFIFGGDHVDGIFGGDHVDRTTFLSRHHNGP